MHYNKILVSQGTTQAWFFRVPWKHYVHLAFLRAPSLAQHVALAFSTSRELAILRLTASLWSCSIRALWFRMFISLSYSLVLILLAILLFLRSSQSQGSATKPRLWSAVSFRNGISEQCCSCCSSGVSFSLASCVSLQSCKASMSAGLILFRPRP